MSSTSGQHQLLDGLIRLDQLAAMRRSLQRAIPVNIVLGVAALVVASGRGALFEGALWFGASLTANVARFWLCRVPVRESRVSGLYSIPWHLAMHRISALASGAIWALVAVLSNGFTTPDSIFYLAVLCGITAGSVTYGTSYWPVPVLFIVPPLVVVILCLFRIAHFDTVMLAGTVCIYLVALILAAREGDSAFRDFSRLTHEARELASSLELANQRSATTAREMLHRATHDALTGLLNRSGILRQIESAYALGHKPIGLMLLDLDDFKAVNDVFGHATGDRVLRKIADRLMEVVPADAYIARLGGDEFAIVFMPLLRDTTELSSIAQNILSEISRPFVTFESSSVSGTIGISVAENATVGELLANADAALYMAKMAGRNRWQYFDAELQQRIEIERDMERELPEALRSGAIEVWFQPICRAGGGVDSLEALLRWHHPRHGSVNPALLVSVAARIDQTEPLFRHVAGEATRMAATLAAHGYHDIRTALNVSPREAARIQIDAVLMRCVSNAGIAPDMLELEVTEETALDEMIIHTRLAPLAAAGVRIVIDDFGVGYASLAAILHINVNKLKIDRSFVADLDTNVKARRLLQSLIGLGHSLDLEVIAEGVERAEVMEVLERLGCDLLQGYYLARPMRAADLLDWLSVHAQPR